MSYIEFAYFSFFVFAYEYYYSFSSILGSYVCVFNPEYLHLFHQKTKYLFFTFELNPRLKLNSIMASKALLFPSPSFHNPAAHSLPFLVISLFYRVIIKEVAFFFSSTSSRHVISQSSSSLLSPPMPMNVFSFFFFLKKQKTTPATNTTTTTPPTMKPIWVSVKPK
jgi:hypothetical protein